MSTLLCTYIFNCVSVLFIVRSNSEDQLELQQHRSTMEKVQSKCAVLEDLVTELEKKLAHHTYIHHPVLLMFDCYLIDCSYIYTFPKSKLYIASMYVCACTYIMYVCMYICLYVLVLTLPLYYEQVGRARYATNGSREVRILEPKLRLYGSAYIHTYRHTHTHLCAKIQRVLNYSVRMEGRLSTAQRGNRKMEASV